MSNKNHLCPPLGTLLPPAELRMIAASLEATATDDALLMPADRRRALWQMAVCARSTAYVVESGSANTDGHLAALELEMRGNQ